MSPASTHGGCGVMVTTAVSGPARARQVRQHRCGQPSVIPPGTGLDEFGPYLTTPMCGDHAAKLGRRQAVAS